jgi:quercetin dioxygenase-like cupin family protein/transcriptional regulator with XRE-family HTH domain
VASVKDIRGEVREFLTTRRAKITPERAGLPSYGGRRRVAGLRRDEVALLAGISIEYYTRLERGNIRGASAEVLDGIARALQLDEVERVHLADLVRTANAARPVRRRPDRLRVRASVQRLLDSMTATAAFVRNGRLDILSANQLGYALYAPVFDDPVRPANLARFIFLDQHAAGFYRDWDGIAQQAVGSLRAEAGRDPYDRALTDLVGELSTRSQEFRVRWAGHDVRYYRSGVQPFRHPLAGDLDLDYDALEIPADPELTIVAYSAAPGSPSAQAMRLLIPLSGERTVDITPKPPTAKGPAEWFTGDVFIDGIVRGEEPSHVRVSAVRFTPSARTAWHSHAVGQTLYVTDGRGLVQSRGGEVAEIRAGDIVRTPADEWHWHGAAPDHFMTHLSITEAVPGETRPEADWGEHVTDDEYRGR